MQGLWEAFVPTIRAALHHMQEQEAEARQGFAHRIERLRATGNGVDPVVACTAFLSLGSLLGLWGRTEAREPLLMTAEAWSTPSERIGVGSPGIVPDPAAGEVRHADTP